MPKINIEIENMINIDFSHGLTNKQIQEKYKLSSSTVSTIKNRLIYKNLINNGKTLF